jgi:hypothetical protein
MGAVQYILELCERGAIHLRWNFVRAWQYIYAYWNFMSVAQYICAPAY